MTPTKPGYYWALWIKAVKDTAEDSLSNEWEIVEVWENFIGEPCEADADIKFAVSVHGVQQTQWLDCFRWGNPVLSKLDIERVCEETRDIRELARQVGGIGMITLGDRMNRIERMLRSAS